MSTACFTGHRPPVINSNNAPFVKSRLSEETEKLIAEGFGCFITGMAQGTDMLAAEAVLELKQKYPEISLICAVPCRGQSARWNVSEKRRYEKILSLADKTVILSDKYTPWCMQQRNMYMVDNSDAVIAVFSGAPGGTANTLAYANRKDKRIILISPGGDAQ